MSSTTYDLLLNNLAGATAGSYEFVKVSSILACDAFI